MKKGEWCTITHMLFHYSELLIGSLSYAIAYYLTPAIVLSQFPFRSFMPLTFIDFITGTQLTSLKILAHAPCFSTFAPMCPHLENSSASCLLPHTVPGYLLVNAACPSKLSSKATFSRDVSLIISVGKSLTFLWTSRGSHMVLIIFDFVLQQCLLSLRDEI